MSAEQRVCRNYIVLSGRPLCLMRMPIATILIGVDSLIPLVFSLEMVDNSNNLCKPPLRLVISSVGSSIRLFHPEGRPIRHPLLALSPLSPHHAPAPASTLSGSQAETFGKGQESTSFAVHCRFVFPAAIAGVRCRYRCARWLPPR